MAGIYDVGLEAFIDLLLPVTVENQVAGGYVKGKWVPVPPVLVPAMAVVHPMSPNEINKLNIEGYRGLEMIAFYFLDDVNISITDNATQKIGDVIIYNGNRYIAMKFIDWKTIGGYTVYYAERNE
jgi:hypothetical protein